MIECSMVRVGEEVDHACGNDVIGVTEDGALVCLICSVGMRKEGFKVFYLRLNSDTLFDGELEVDCDENSVSLSDAQTRVQVSWSQWDDIVALVGKQRIRVNGRWRAE